MWRAPGNVTIEKRPPQMPGAPLPLGAAQPQPAAPQAAFQPAPPAMIRRPVRRMPRVEELPLVAQNEIKAQAGQAPQLGLAAQKRQGGLPRAARPALVARGKSRNPRWPRQSASPSSASNGRRLRRRGCRPSHSRSSSLRPNISRSRRPGEPQAEPQPQLQAAPQEACGSSVRAPLRRSRLAPKRVEPQPRLAQPPWEITSAAPAESQGDDDLEIPAFLRRRAN